MNKSEIEELKQLVEYGVENGTNTTISYDEAAYILKLMDRVEKLEKVLKEYADDSYWYPVEEGRMVHWAFDNEDGNDKNPWEIAETALQEGK